MIRHVLCVGGEWEVATDLKSPFVHKCLEQFDQHWHILGMMQDHNVLKFILEL